MRDARYRACARARAKLAPTRRMRGACTSERTNVSPLGRDEDMNRQLAQLFVERGASAFSYQQAVGRGS